MQLKNNKVIMAAAGSGKTWGICNSVIKDIKTSNKKILIVTYTNKGVETIEKEYKKQNFGVIDSNVKVKTWFQFLLHDLIKPYQRYIVNGYNLINSIDFSNAYGYINFQKRGTVRHYLNKNNDILSNTVSELVVDINEKSQGKSIRRLEEIYSSIYIDEIQDVAGEDIKILEMLFDSNIFVQCVGDYKQATYKTHNSKKNKAKTGNNIINYFRELEKNGKIDLEFNRETRRFGKEMCEFSNSFFEDSSDDVESKKDYLEENMGVFLIENKDVEIYYSKYKPTVLRYDQRTSTDLYPAFNFGQCKGMTFDRVLIYPNEIYKKFLKKNIIMDSPYKYYVSATRAKYSIAFVVDKIYENNNFKFCDLYIDNIKIKVSKYYGNKTSR